MDWKEIQLSGSILSLLSLFQGGAGLDELVQHSYNCWNFKCRRNYRNLIIVENVFTDRFIEILLRMNPAEMIADWTEVVLVNKRSWTVRLSVRKFLKQPFWTTARLTHFTKLSSWKQSLSFTYHTRIHRVAVEFLRNRARSNFRPYDSCSKQVRICWNHQNQFLSFIFHHTYNISITYVSWNEHLLSFFISSFR